MLKPAHGPFVFKPVLLVSCPAIVFLFGMFFISPSLSLVLLLGLAILDGMILIWYQKKYTKTEYIFTDEKIRVKTGTFFSDSDSEVLWSKVVQQSLRKDILQKFLFRTGDVALQAAGQVDAEIKLRELSESEQIFENVLRSLDPENPLNQDELKNIFYQSRLGIFLDCLFPTVLFSLIWIGATFVLFEYGNLPPAFQPLKLWGPAAMIFVTAVIYSIVAIIKANISYKIYDRYVERVLDFGWYSQSLIPLEMLTDVNVKEIFPKRFFGLSNLKLSVPGLGEQTSLVNLVKGVELREQLQGRSDEIKGITDDSTTTERGKRFDALPSFMSQMFTALMFLFGCLIGTQWVSHYVDNNLAAVFPSINQWILSSLSYVPLVIAVGFFLYRAIQYGASSFAVEGNRVELTFSFLNRSVTSLSTDKIKAIVKHQGIIERLFGTYSITFHSIGTEKNVTFFCIKDTTENAEMLRHIRKREGCYGEEVTKTIRPEVSGLGLLFEQPVQIVAPVIFILVPSLLIGFGIQIPYAHAILMGGVIASILTLTGTVMYLQFYFKNCMSMNLYSDFLEFKEGFFITKSHYVYYPDIRNIEYAKEPFGSNGWLKVDYASGGSSNRESRTQNAGNQLGNLIEEYLSGGAFYVYHIQDVDAQAEVLEDVFSGHIGADKFDETRRERSFEQENVILSSQPVLLPYLIQGGFYGVIPFFVFAESLPGLAIVSVLALVPIGGILGVIYRSMISYSIKENQVESSYWVFLTRTKSIKYKNVDNIETDRNIFDKVLGTGQVNVSTTGGSGVEFKAKYLRNYQQFYERLQDEYNEARTSETI